MFLPLIPPEEGGVSKLVEDFDILHNTHLQHHCTDTEGSSTEDTVRKPPVLCATLRILQLHIWNNHPFQIRRSFFKANTTECPSLSTKLLGVEE